MKRREVAVHEADFHVANLHLYLLEHVAVLLKVLEILNAHVEGWKVTEHAERMIRWELWVTSKAKINRSSTIILRFNLTLVNRFCLGFCCWNPFLDVTRSHASLHLRHSTRSHASHPLDRIAHRCVTAKKTVLINMQSPSIYCSTGAKAYLITSY